MSRVLSALLAIAALGLGIARLPGLVRRLWRNP